MKRAQEDKLLNPKPVGKIAEARDYGIDLTQLLRNLRLTPAQRIRNNDEAVNSVRKFESSMRLTKKKTEAEV